MWNPSTHCDTNYCDESKKLHLLSEKLHILTFSWLSGEEARDGKDKMNLRHRPLFKITGLLTDHFLNRFIIIVELFAFN